MIGDLLKKLVRTAAYQMLIAMIARTESGTPSSSNNVALANRCTPPKLG